MDIHPNDKVVKDFRINDLTKYLHLTGWRSAKSYKDKIRVFEGFSDIDGEPLEIALPLDERSHNASIYKAGALNLLCALTEDTPENIVKRINFYDRDLLSIRNLESDDPETINLPLASTQVTQIKQLISYAACSEFRPRPHFYLVSIPAKKAVRSFRFGHTFSGSFGFTVESIVTDQQQLSLSVSDRDVPENNSKVPREFTILPLERRIMERIVRGLISLNQAVIRNDPSFIVRSYNEGLNSNMCRAILQMSQNKNLSLEYKVLWSPKIKPSEDVVNFSGITIDDHEFSYLEEALRELRRFAPEETTIIGKVTALISRHDPLGSEDTPRLVTIRWSNRGVVGRPVDVGVILNKDDYIKASTAHIEWKNVSISGSILRMGNEWQLVSPHDFQILSDDSEQLALEPNQIQ